MVMAEISPKSPLETLIMHTPVPQVQSFLRSSKVTRQAIAQQEDTTLVLPLRGAMPMFWTADGQPEVELPSMHGGQTVEMPLGTYTYVNAAGQEKTTSPERHRKKAIIYSCLNEAEKPIQSLTLLDEVQRGGTVGPLVEYTLKYARDYDVPLPVRLIATQDSRPKLASEPKTSDYKQLATNSVPGVVSTVVPMPLIACDRDNLLDSVRLDSTTPHSNEPVSAFSVQRNQPAEQLFRSLGSMVRRREVAQDASFVRQLVDSQLPLSERAAGRVDKWLGWVVLSQDTHRTA